MNNRPSNAFVLLAWIVLAAGMISYLYGLWNANMMLNEKGYYFTVLMYGLFVAVSVQKSVRDRQEGIPVTPVYYGISWFSSILSLALLVIGLWNANLALSEKGFYGMSFLLSLLPQLQFRKILRYCDG